MVITGEQEATLIQIVGELERGLQVLRAELKQGDFTASRNTAKLLSVLVNLADSTIKTAGRKRATPSGADSRPAEPPG